MGFDIKTLSKVTVSKNTVKKWFFFTTILLLEVSSYNIVKSILKVLKRNKQHIIYGPLYLYTFTAFPKKIKFISGFAMIVWKLFIISCKIIKILNCWSSQIIIWYAICQFKTKSKNRLWSRDNTVEINNIVDPQRTSASRWSKHFANKLRHHRL